MKKRFTEEQIIGFLRQAQGGVPVKELSRKHGFSDATSGCIASIGRRPERTSPSPGLTATPSRRSKACKRR